MAKVWGGSEASTTLRLLGKRIRRISFILLVAGSTTERHGVFGFAGTMRVNGGRLYFPGVRLSRQAALASGSRTTSEASSYTNHPANLSRRQNLNLLRSLQGQAGLLAAARLAESRLVNQKK